MSARGERRTVERGEILVAPGHPTRCVLVLAGELQIVREQKGAETLVAVVRAGMFTGELSLLSGRPAFAYTRVSESGEIIDVPRAELLSLSRVMASSATS